MATRANGKALIDFWQSPVVENTVSARTAADLATACREVLGANKDGESINLRTCPVEDLLNIFAKERAGYRPQTLAAYKSRFRKAVRWYLGYLDDPTAWPQQHAIGKKRRAEDDQPESQGYLFPLRANVMLTFDLPLDLTPIEAKRLATFIECLVFPGRLS